MSLVTAAKSFYALTVPETIRARIRKRRKYGVELARHWWYRLHTGDRFLAPPHLRFRVAGGYDIAGFLANGKHCADDVNRALQPLGRTVYSFSDVLDFGCGCGRMLRWFSDAPPTCRLYGTDIDAEAIAWDRKAFPFARFTVNDPLPPLPYPDGQFDLVYSHSVFTHLDEDYQFRWLEELRRVTRPGAILALSVHGRFVREQKRFTPELTTELARKGILFLRIGDPKWQGIFPDFYQKTFHEREYVVREWSRYFEIVDYREQGIGNYQDLVVLRRPA